MVTMVTVWGGRATPPVKAAISVNLAADASAPVWATATVGDTTAARAPARSAAGASAPVRAATPAPLGVCGCPLRRLLPRCLPHQLELIVSVVVGRNRDASATGAQSLELCRRRIRHRCCFYFCPCCCCQFRQRQPCRPCRCHCSLPSLTRVPLPQQPRPPASAARSRRPSAETVLRIWHASGGLLRGKESTSDVLLLVCAGKEG
jgi:hypothetical protein